MSKSTIIIILITLIIGGGGVYLALGESSKPVLPVNTSAWVKGKLDSKVLVEEFSDFQCPACKATEDSIVKPLLLEYQDRIKFEYRQFPLTSIHPYAMKAAEASEAAGAQGKFWEMHSKLFEMQNTDGTNLSVDNLKIYAKDLGLDTEKFNTELSNGTYKGDVNTDIEEGNKRGISATPTFYVNGVIIEAETLQDIYSKLKGAIDSELAKG